MHLSSLFLRDSMKYFLSKVLQSISLISWWRLAGSNRWPPACKAGALPAELNPRIPDMKWWAKMDSNHRPHDYQSCALASWAIGPYLVASSCLAACSPVPSKLNNVNLFKHFVLTLGRYRRILVSPEVSLERRWSSRTFRYGYLVTTSPQLPDPPSAAPSFAG